MQVADFHCDLLSYLAEGDDRTAYDAASHASIPQMQAGQVALQTLAVYTKTTPDSVRQGTKQAEIFFQIEKKYPEFKTIKPVMAIENASSFCEEQEPLDKGFERLQSWLKRAGKIAYISLTWNGENRFGGGNATQVGLKPDGKELLRLMEGKNIAIDLSHTSDRLAEELLEFTEGLEIPVIASHSNFRTVSFHPRNLPDIIAKEIGARKGLIGLNFVRVFLGNQGPEAFLKQAEHADKLGLLNHLCFGADFFPDHDMPPELSYMKPFFLEGFENSSCYPRVIDLFLKYLPRDILARIACHNLAKFLCFD